MVMASPLQSARFEGGGTISLLKSDNGLVIAGYASVEMVDKQGDLITTGALKGAFDNFMKADGFRNVQLAHPIFKLAVLSHSTLIAVVDCGSPVSMMLDYSSSSKYVMTSKRLVK